MPEQGEPIHSQARIAEVLVLPARARKKRTECRLSARTSRVWLTASRSAVRSNVGANDVLAGSKVLRRRRWGRSSPGPCPQL